METNGQGVIKKTPAQNIRAIASHAIVKGSMASVWCGIKGDKDGMRTYSRVVSLSMCAYVLSVLL